ncbi:hypothetical protein L1049_000916 [Liquidambar formosana]|uniref:DUF4408 domain-containing protein n=1 Tax=Liquidambar formosana TaxID=63359 RepID=A0AAP0N9M7_LIQFO
MDKSKKSQFLKLSLIAALFIITPLLSSSLRPTYLYFIINLLIIGLGAEAGLLSSFSDPSEDKKPSLIAAPKAVNLPSESSSDKEVPAKTIDKAVTSECSGKKAKVVEKSASEKIVGTVKMNKVKKCPSTPSIFFIGSGENEPTEEFHKDDDEEEEEVGEVSGQELFTRAETFIGNFYKQLKMQREESWKKIHGLYHKAF